MRLPHIAVIVTTYNRPQALEAVLDSLERQSYRNFEVLVADDGSGRDTARLIEEFSERAAYPLRHVWQRDQGFRAAAIRNQAAALTHAPYLLFLDGDSLLRPDFLRRHAMLARRGHFVAGNRVQLSRHCSQRVLEHGLAVAGWNSLHLLAARFMGAVKRFLPLLRLPLGRLRDRTPRHWEGVRAYNLGVWRKDFLGVNGFEERYRGRGYAAQDLAIRLIRHKVWRRDGRFATTVLHLWHPQQRRPGAIQDLDRLQGVERGSAVTAEQGVGQYLS